MRLGGGWYSNGLGMRVLDGEVGLGRERVEDPDEVCVATVCVTRDGSPVGLPRNTVDAPLASRRRMLGRTGRGLGTITAKAEGIGL